ncbi:molybdopterin cofactor-binding domain-containing protein [Flocculibacter collagenilyticus]|uniref:molybdopterin cofactor-binding domain-containing protein n=1 Tax=Flocculibacter collagenilyticus TaxID=2744479 RepID=UPI0018F47AA6|nr:molybdopterin cofactor-binding domain-containing protein [Flocculibacter collagenilyticus]
MNNKHKVQNISRRNFLKATGITTGGLVLGVGLPSWMPAWAEQYDSLHKLNLFIQISPDNTVYIIAHRSEMGQGIRTGLPQIVADEMEADWQKVKIIQGQSNKAFGSQNTDGSRSVRRFYTKMREMGAVARHMLEQAAANQWQVHVDECEASNHVVKHRPTGKRFSFGELAETAAKLPMPKSEQIILKNESKFKYIGKPIKIVDLPNITSGNTQFGVDVQLPNMLYASIARTPVTGGAVASFDKKEAMKVAGVSHVIEMPNYEGAPLFNSVAGVAVVANNTWSAMEGVKKLNIKWENPIADNAKHSSDEYLNIITKNAQAAGKVSRSKGDVKEALSQAANTIDATYTAPYLAHATMEPPMATANFDGKKLEIWACTQNPQGVQEFIAGKLGLEPENIVINITLLGGGFGRKSKHDFSVEAARLAMQLKRPVKVVWSREDDIQHDYYHSISAQYYKAGLNQNNDVTAWLQRTAFPSIASTFEQGANMPADFELGLGFGNTPIGVQNLQCEKCEAPAHIRIGWLRSVSNIQHAFGLGSFVDEIARYKKQPPQQTWIELLGSDDFDPNAEGFKYNNKDYPLDKNRIKKVLDKAIKTSGFSQNNKKGEGWGVSVHYSFYSYVAVASKVRLENNQVTVLEMHCVSDVGQMVNPDRVHSQMEGAMIFGLSAALMGEISVKDGRVTQSNFHDYPILRMNQCPDIHIELMPSKQVPTGVGEPGVPPVAPSITNAIVDAGGMRIRDLPVNKHYGV